MREVINTITASSAGASVTGAMSGQLIIGITGLIFMILFGTWGAWLQWKNSKAIQNAISSGDLQTALKLKVK